jgi:hypothetical protein
MPYLGPAPADSIVDTAGITDDAVTAAKIAANAVDSSEIAAGSVDIAHLSASGSAGSGNFLRGDNSWQTAGLTGVTTGSGNVTITSGNLIVASGNGIDFSATADSTGTMTSELLDDYEEGTFTPTAASNFSGSFSNVEGHYVKVGSVVAIWMVATLSNTSDGSTATIDGLPFVSTSFAQHHHALTQGYTTSGLDGPLYPCVSGGTNEMFWYTKGTSHGTADFPSYSEIGCGSSTIAMSVGGTYRTNS